MDQNAVIEQLEELARGFGIEICYEPITLEEETINVVGGFCKLRGEQLLIINSNAGARNKIKILVQALRRFDLDKIYIRPAIRDLLNATTTAETEPIVIEDRS